jgi:DNA topoisomerase I
MMRRYAYLCRYDGKVMRLSADAEEAMTFYARMLDHEYTSKKTFNDNFFKDWKTTMTAKEATVIHDLSKCDMTEVAAYYKRLSEQRKLMTKEEKNRIKEENERQRALYGTCVLDGHKECIGML